MTFNFNFTEGDDFDPEEILKQAIDDAIQEMSWKISSLSCAVHHQSPNVNIIGTELNITNICCDVLSAEIDAVQNT